MGRSLQTSVENDSTVLPPAHDAQADLDDLVDPDDAAGRLEIDHGEFGRLQRQRHQRRVEHRPAVIVRLDETRVAGQQRAHHDLRLRHLMPTRPEQASGDGGRRQRLRLPEQEVVCLRPESAQVIGVHGVIISYPARPGQSPRPLVEPRVGRAPVAVGHEFHDFDPDTPAGGGRRRPPAGSTVDSERIRSEAYASPRNGSSRFVAAASSRVGHLPQAAGRQGGQLRVGGRHHGLVAQVLDAADHARRGRARRARWRP